MSAKHGKAYKEMVAVELEKFDEQIQALALNSMFSTLQRACINPSWLNVKGTSPIVEYLLTLLDQLPENEPLLVFTRHRMVTKYLGDLLPNSAMIYGGTKDKTKIIQESKQGKYRAVVANIDSVGIGLNLQHFNNLACAELPFRGDKWEQMIGRIWRQGQKKTCNIFIPVIKKTIQEKIYARLLKNDRDICEVLTTKTALEDFLVL